MLNSGDIVTEHICYRNARTAFEERIWGDQVFLANKYLCESCSDIYFSLVELGYGFNLGDDMRDLLRDFQDIENARKVET